MTLPTYNELKAAHQAGTLYALLAGLTPAERIECYELIAMQTGRTVAEVQRRIERLGSEDAPVQVADSAAFCGHLPDYDELVAQSERDAVRARLLADDTQAAYDAAEAIDRGAVWTWDDDVFVCSRGASEHRIDPGGHCAAHGAWRLWAHALWQAAQLERRINDEAASVAA
jgi:hypothetical protein